MKFNELNKKIFLIHGHFSQKAAQSVDMMLTARNWFIGFYIEKYEGHGQDRAKYGEKLMDQMAIRLSAGGMGRCDRSESSLAGNTTLIRKSSYFLSLLFLLFYFAVAIAGAAVQVQLIEINRESPVADTNVSVILDVDKSQVASESLKSDSQGILELSQFFEKNGEVLKKYENRTLLVLWIGEHKTNIKINEISKTPTVVRVDLGPVLVKGHFANTVGKIIEKYAELFPQEVREYLDPNESFWSGQLRLYQSTETSNGKLVSNKIWFERDGTFQLFLQKNRGVFRVSCG